MGRVIVSFLVIWAIFFAVFYMHQDWTVNGWKTVGKALLWGLVAAAVTVVLLALIVVFL